MMMMMMWSGSGGVALVKWDHNSVVYDYGTAFIVVGDPIYQWATLTSSQAFNRGVQINGPALAQFNIFPIYYG